jgi:hypothetical protein
MNIPQSFLANGASPRMSDRYAFVNTQRVIEAVADEGWKVHEIASLAPRKSEMALYSKHQVELRNPSLPQLNDNIPRLLFVNAHDGSSGARCLAGLFRFACSNGLVVGNTIGSFALRHTGDVATEVAFMLREMGKRVTQAQHVSEKWGKIQLDNGSINRFAEYAALLRWGDTDRFRASDLLRVRRAEDDGGDLWKVFNRVQENAARGGLSGQSRNGRAMTSVPITGISRTNTFNADLWELAEEFAQ